MLLAVPFIVVFSTSADSEQAQWPALRGPNYNGLIHQGNPPVEWNEKKNIRWKTAIPGAGHASPVLWGDFVYVQTAVEVAIDNSAATPKYQYKLLAVHRDSGDIAWEKTVREAVPVEDSHHRTATFASNTGITDGEHLYAFFGSQGSTVWTSRAT
jgi:outer membrane protein assembly factor BamB